MIKVHYLRVLAAIGIIFLAACTESSSSSSTDPDSDLAVTAVADFDVDEGETGNLSIADSAGSISTYAWTQVNAGSNSVSISGSNTKAASFTAPSDLAAVTELTFRITVSNSSDSKSDDVVVTVNNTEGPTVTASADSPVDEGTEGVALTSTASGASSYKWMQTNVGDYEVSISNDSSASASFDAPGSLIDGNVTLTFQITATDNDDNPATATVEVNVTDLDIPTIYDVVISDDNLIDASESASLSSVSFSGKTDSVGDGQTVTLVINGTIEFTGTVQADGSFPNTGSETVNLSGLADGTYSLTADVSDADGNAAEQFVGSVTKDVSNPENVTAATVPAGTYKVGDDVVITMTADNNQTGLTLSSDSTLNGVKLSGAVDNDDGTYTATYTIAEGDADVDTISNLSVNLFFVDEFGNESATKLGSGGVSVETGSGDALSIGNDIVIDANSPLQPAVAVPDTGSVVTYLVGHEMELTIVSTLSDGSTADTGLELVSGTFNGQALDPNDFVETSTLGTYTAIYTVTANDPAIDSDQNVLMEMVLRDAAGNESDLGSFLVGMAGNAVINVEDGSISNVKVSVDNIINADDTLTEVAISGDTYNIDSGTAVEVNLTDSTNHATVTATVSNNGSFSGNLDISSPSISDDTTGISLIASIYEYDSGNTTVLSTLHRFTDNSVIKDTVTPSVTGVTIENAAHKVGDEVEVTIALGGSGEDSLTLDEDSEIAGYPLVNLSGSANSYTATFTVTEGGANVGDSDDIEDVSITVVDAGGNSSEEHTTKISGASGTSIDSNTPVIKIASSNVTIDEGSEVNLSASGTTDINASGDIDTGEGISAAGGGSFTAFLWTQVDEDGQNPVSTASDSIGDSTDTEENASISSTELTDDTEEDLVLYFALTVTDSAGNEALTSPGDDMVTLTVTNKYKTPEISTSIGTSPDFDQVTLSWPVETGLTYKLYRDTEEGCDPIANTSAAGCSSDSAVVSFDITTDPAIEISGSTASITIDGLDLYSTYYYWLAANLANDKVVSLSPALGITTSGPQLNDTGVIAGADYPTGFDTLNGSSNTCDGGYLVDTSGNVIEDPGSQTAVYDFVEFVGEDCEHGRDASHNDDSDGHAGFSFTKVDYNGNALPADATEWYCVVDNVTGLIWEVKVDDDTSLRDKDKTFPFWDGTTGSNQSGAGNVYDTLELAAAVNSADVSLCGLSTGWRLPTAGELLSITNYSVEPSLNGAAVDSAYFLNMQGADHYYWTSTTNLNSTAGATATGVWVYGNGSILSDVSTNYDGQYDGSGYAILVNSTPSGADESTHLNDWSNARYDDPDNLDGTVTDTRTGLMWMKCAYDPDNMIWDSDEDCQGGNNTGTEGAVFHYQAFEQAEAANDLDNSETVSIGDYDDWRVPSVQELYSLVNHAAGNTAGGASINTALFPNFRDGVAVATSISRFWSSTPDASGNGKAYYVDFSPSQTGTVVGTAAMNGDDASKYSIILVRDAN